MSQHALPNARLDGLVMTQSGDDLLVYDTDAHELHHLNASAARVWHLCDGARTVSDIEREVTVELGDHFSRDHVETALATLSAANLLDAPFVPYGQVASASRRRFLKKTAIAGVVAVPAIVSITAPSAARGGSCVNPVAECMDGFLGRNCCAGGPGCEDCGTCQQRESNGNWFCDA